MACGATIKENLYELLKTVAMETRLKKKREIDPFKVTAFLLFWGFKFAEFLVG